MQDGSGTAKFTAPHICVASGGYPIVPKDVPGAEYGITNEGFFAIEVLPSKIAVVGAGYIAVEMAGMLNAIGVEVHMFIRGNTFLRSFDPMIGDTMTARYEAVGVKIHKQYKGFERIERVSDGKGDEKVLKIHVKGEGELVVNELLWAVGRKPEVESLKLEVPGVETGEKGYVVADEFQNTNVEGIYALGDVTGQMELTPGKSHPSSYLQLGGMSLCEKVLTRENSCHSRRPTPLQPPLWPPSSLDLPPRLQQHPNRRILPPRSRHSRSNRASSHHQVWG